MASVAVRGGRTGSMIRRMRCTSLISCAMSVADFPKLCGVKYWQNTPSVFLISHVVEIHSELSSLPQLVISFMQ